MDSRTYYEIHKKDSIEKKMDELMDAFWWYNSRAVSREEASCRGNKDDEAYYKSEQRYMGERIRFLKWSIIEEIKKLKGDKE